jgi:hypothetical protein
VWSQKRFKDPHTEEMPCNPEYAKNIKKDDNSQNGLSDGWLPYKDNDDVPDLTF